MPTTVSWVLPIATALITAVASAFAVWVANSAAHGRMITQLAADAESEKRARRRERLEEFFVGVDRWASHVVDYHTSFRRGMIDEMTYEEAQQLPVGKFKHGVDGHNLYMVAEIYFHDAHDQLEKLTKLQSTLSSIANEFISQIGNDAVPIDPLLTQMDKALDEFEESYHDYLSMVAKHVRELD